MKKIFVLIIIALCPIIMQGQARKMYRQALRTTNLKQKIELLDKVIAEEPKNLDAYFNRALAKNDSGDYHGAIADYSKIIVEAPDADTYFNRGNSRYNLEDFQGAKADYAKAFYLDKNFIDALYSLACAKFDLGEYKDAIKDFDAVLRVIPDLQIAYNYKAAAYVALEDYKKALKAYSSAIVVNPNADAFYNRGVFYLDIRYFQKAKADLNLAVRLNRDNSFVHFYRGASNLFLGKNEDAISDFHKSLKFDSFDFDAMLGLAMAYYKLGDKEKAKTYFKKAKSIVNFSSGDTVDKFSKSYWHLKHFYFFKSVYYDLDKL